ncbi:HNH endonuclease [Promicromonospora sp. Populi]|uniref:HNH endonuclease signature motif containing protein n=1 Tax=Promicromonospora sp. Populi TaxID=3239420 RepID=UPI0034E23160
MDRTRAISTSLAAAVERSLMRAFATGVAATQHPGASATSLPSSASLPTLSWNAVSLDEEGVLPAAMVTWPGHGPGGEVTHAGTTTTPAATDPAVTDPANTAPAATETAVSEPRGTDLAGTDLAGTDPAVAEPVSSVGAASAAGRTGVVRSVDAAILERLPLGAALVDVLARVEVADTDDGVLLDVAARWQEVVSWATAMQSRALGEISRRRGWTEEHNAAAAEISARLRVPQGEANKHMARGAGLAEHPQVMNALHNAVIDTAKADILLRSGNPLTTEQREEAITRYLPQAPDHTRRWLRDKMKAFASEHNGTQETTRHATSRRAVFLDPAENTMAWISAHLPATDAAAVWDAIEQAAHTLRRTPGTTRTLTQARADALVAITTGRIIVPPHPECTPETTPPSTSTSTSTSTSDTSTSGTDTDTSGTSGTGTGTGSIDTVGTPEGPALPRTTVPATGCTCGGCTCGGTTIRVIPVKPQIRVTIAATTLLGLDNTPGHLEGYGPIPADLAARIATDATWQRLLTDPTTGILTDYSTTTYQPGKLLRAAVTARDQTCCFPQCDRPARWSDLDHIHPYNHNLDTTTQPPDTPGQTRAHNLQPLCRAHHLAKTHHGWDVTRDPNTGITTWTAPTGHTYTRPPTQTDPTTGVTTGLTSGVTTGVTTEVTTEVTTGATTGPRTGATTGGTTGVTTAHVSNDITSLAADLRARLGQPPPGNRPSAVPPTAEQLLRLFPEEPPF